MDFRHSKVISSCNVVEIKFYAFEFLLNSAKFISGITKKEKLRNEETKMPKT